MGEPLKLHLNQSCERYSVRAVLERLRVDQQNSFQQNETAMLAWRNQPNHLRITDDTPSA